MKKIVSMLLLVFLLVGCAQEVKGAGGLTQADVSKMVINAVKKYEGQDNVTINAVRWTEETEIINGIHDGLYEVMAQYKDAGKIYSITLVIQLVEKDYRLIRYDNLTTGVKSK